MPQPPISKTSSKNSTGNKTNKFFLLATFVLYGAFSSPTPDAVTWAELAIGLCLLCAITPARVLEIFSGLALWQPPPARQFLGGCFLALLIPGTINGMLSGHHAWDILRDIIPLGFFFLPLFLYRAPTRFLLPGLLFTGFVFALRFWPASGLTLARFGLNRGNDELLYLTSSPAVLFSGLYFLFLATDLRHLSPGRRIACIVAAMICLLTIVATLQRAAIILAGASVFFVLLFRARRHPFALYFLVTVGAAALFLAGPTILDVLMLIWRKTREVGDNARFAELHSVINVMGNDPLHWIFGLGWGAKIMTAASGYAEVRYTHMLGSYALFKTGLIGLCATLGYAAWVIHRVIRHLPQRPALCAAGIPSLLLGFLLYPSFKMLCFGAMLALLTLKESHEQRPHPVYQPGLPAR